MVGELLLTYRARRHGTGSLEDLITNPGIVDTSFKEFLSENEFIKDVEALLINIHIQSETAQSVEATVAFIAVDIDNQSSRASKYGDLVTRNLSREIGLRIQGQLQALFTKQETHQLYHVSTD